MMIRRLNTYKRLIGIFGAVVMAGVCIILAWPKSAPPQVEPAVSPPPPIPRPVETDAPPTPTPTVRQPQAEPTQPGAYRPGVPSSGLAELIQKYQDQGDTGDARKLYNLTMFIDLAMRNKESGKTRWKSENWMKSPEYYQNLDTVALAEECFAGAESRSLFGWEMSVYFNDPMRGYYSLKIYHNGFAELFERNDFWKGLVHAYEVLSSKITTQNDYDTIAMGSVNLGMMGTLYTIQPIKEKIKGREKELLAANYNTLLRYQAYMAERVPKGERLGFLGEPTWVANVALMLAHEIDTVKFARIEPEITGFRTSGKQIPAELYVKDYIDLIVERLKDFL